MFLPDSRRQGEIQFVFAKPLPYRTRLWIIAALLVAGFALQILAHVALGAPLLLGASLLGVVKGFSNVPEHLTGRREWRGAERRQLENVVELGRKTRSWDQSFLDITCSSGAVGLLLVAAGVAGVALLLEASGQGQLRTPWLVDCVVLLGPHWVTGVRRILTNDPLVLKIRELLYIMDFWEPSRAEGEALMGQMEVLNGPKGEMPVDAKLVLRIPALGDEFLGLQVQVVLNRVEGKDYPYLYCVLVARRSFDLFGRLAPPVAPPGMVVETQRQEADDVDVIIIRQKTSRTSGYHTSRQASQRIFASALQQARHLTMAPDTPG